MSNIDVDTRDKAAAAGFSDPGERGADPRDEKKYSDNDLDKIIAKKINRERARYDKMLNKGSGAGDPEDPVDRRLLDLDIRERKLQARERLAAVDLPESYLQLLDYSSDDGFSQSVEKVTQFVSDLMDMVEAKRSRGSTPKDYGIHQGQPDRTKEAFGL